MPVSKIHMDWIKNKEGFVERYATVLIGTFLGGLDD